MTDFETVDFFTDESLSRPVPILRLPAVEMPGGDPPSWCCRHRTRGGAGGVQRPRVLLGRLGRGTVFGTALRADGDDVTELIEQHRAQVPMSEHITTQDPPLHTRTRGLLNKLITPKRLKENEDFMWRLADKQLDKFISGRQVRVPGGLREAVLPPVIADLLGVPAEDHDEFQRCLRK